MQPGKVLLPLLCSVLAQEEAAHFTTCFKMKNELGTDCPAGGAEVFLHPF